MVPGQVDQAPLLVFLKAKSSLYHGKVLELREAVQGWLNYIPHTFPHYTRHTVEHSDEIILQVSKLLFREDDPEQSVVHLSAIEAYMLCAAAYLHDAGMVVSDREKTEILRSSEWHAWTAAGEPGAKRWLEVARFRQAQEPPDEIRHFLIDVQTRYLIAEFVRRTHHLRATRILAQYQSSLGRFAFDDPILARTISNICLSHGLMRYELDDSERFPDRADIRGEQANVRFLAILLRLGDLLDMSADRACPLLLNAACSLPSDSLAHWTQYQRIVFRLTAPDKIAVTAECESQEEHRVLEDWCQWLAKEVGSAVVLMARAQRHGDWRAPSISTEGVDATIRIRPAPGAAYIPARWTFVLDQDAVFERLIYDVYDSPQIFVRELVQNALDAIRCQMYADLIDDGIQPPAYPTQVAEDRRSRYGLQISLRATERPNPLSGEVEARQVLSIDDNGIGMDREIIQDFLLQVGRSYYTTEGFRRDFGFVPASRFGVGFLSVFAASDSVTIETHKPRSAKQDGPIRLTLTGPRNYLLVERGTRRPNGTRIDVLLRENLTPGSLTKLVTNWCRHVEFPIQLDDLGEQALVTAERPEQFTYEIPDVTDEKAKLAIRAFPVNRAGIEGAMYVFARVDDRGESWIAWSWAQYTYPNMHPAAARPKSPGNLVCLHGIAVSGAVEDDGYVGRHPTSARVDYRGETRGMTLSRAGPPRPSYGSDMPELASRWEELLQDHLATSPRAAGPDSWVYKHALVEHFPLPSFWTRHPQMLRLIEPNGVRLLSLEELTRTKTLTTVSPEGLKSLGKGIEAPESAVLVAAHEKRQILLSTDLEVISAWFRRSIFEERAITRVWWSEGRRLAIDWTIDPDRKGIFGTGLGPVRLADLPEPSVVAFTIHKTIDPVYVDVLLNNQHQFAQWLVRVEIACHERRYGLKAEQFDKLLDLLDSAARYGFDYFNRFRQYLEGWKKLGELPPELIPPEIDIAPEAFRLKAKN